MNQIEMLARQTREAYAWVGKLIQSIPADQWNVTPEGIDSNIGWQIGHLTISWYYHSVMCIVGHQMEILQQIPMKEYDSLFRVGSPDLSVGKVSPSDLHHHMTLVSDKSMEIIKSLSVSDLERNLEPVSPVHPLAHNKFEAIDWNIKHTMWHCGQLGMLRRVVDKRFDFWKI